jgi:2-polyprenyl-3-methyl-5-hydroxy-6-metoxy-1,4-benzoquinol methylase
MKELFTTRSSCRLCGSKNLELVVPLGDSPVSEKYLTKENLLEKQDQVPLDLYFCLECTHVQLLAVVEPDFLWSDFTFKTANNPALVAHFKDIAQRIMNFNPIDKNDLIIDIGSNDGTLLRCFKDVGYDNVLGVDPADEIANEATQNGIPTINAYMDKETANKIFKEHGKASVITANNVYAHVDDLSGMTNAIKAVLAEDGIFVFEVSYLLDVVEKMLIGTIFHEHLCYHSVKAMSHFLESQDMELIHVERGPEQGGSIVGYAQFSDGSQDIQNSVSKLLKLEKERRLDRPETIRGMYEGLESVKTEVRNLISDLRKDSKTVAGFGAARAGTTLLSYFGIGSQLDFLVDDNKTKHYKFSPGDKLEVFPTSDIYTKKPDYLLILAWLHADKIMQSHKKYLDEGGTFLCLFPGVKEVKK